VTRFKALWDGLRSSLWFIPTIAVAFAVGLALVLIESDGWIDPGVRTAWPRIFGAGADGARGVLSVIAGSMATIAGVTFSITVTTLALTSSQYTSRVLRNFMRDRSNQLVLGVFVGVFAYCLVVLRTVRGGDEGAFVPSLAVLAAVVLALIGIGHLIYFIHHVASSIQASNVVAAAADETIAAIDRLFPVEIGEPIENSPPPLPSEWSPIRADRTGYIVGMDADELTRSASELDRILRLERGVGEFVSEGDVLASVSGAVIQEEQVDRIRGLVSIGRQRTSYQDAGFGIRQIVDVALKALSPGVNDTTTAIICVDYLGAIMAKMADRTVPSPFRKADGKLRVIARGPTFERLLEEAFDQIRQNSSGNPAVLARIVAALIRVASRTREPDRLAAVRDQVGAIADVARETIPSARDRQPVVDLLDRFRQNEGGQSDDSSSTQR